MLPIVVEQFLALLVGIADTLMVSYAGESAVSSISLVNQLMYVSFVMNGINVAGNALGIFAFYAGVACVAYPSLISRVFAAVVMLALFCLALGPAFITVVGQYIGAGDPEGTQYYMKKLLRITYLGGAV